MCARAEYFGFEDLKAHGETVAAYVATQLNPQEHDAVRQGLELINLLFNVPRNNAAARAFIWAATQMNPDAATGRASLESGISGPLRGNGTGGLTLPYFVNTTNGQKLSTTTSAGGIVTADVGSGVLGIGDAAGVAVAGPIFPYGFGSVAGLRSLALRAREVIPSILFFLLIYPRFTCGVNPVGPRFQTGLQPGPPRHCRQL